MMHDDVLGLRELLDWTLVEVECGVLWLVRPFGRRSGRVVVRVVRCRTPRVKVESSNHH